MYIYNACISSLKCIRSSLMLVKMQHTKHNPLQASIDILQTVHVTVACYSKSISPQQKFLLPLFFPFPHLIDIKSWYATHPMKTTFDYLQSNLHIICRYFKRVLQVFYSSWGLFEDCVITCKAFLLFEGR